MNIALIGLGRVGRSIVRQMVESNTQKNLFLVDIAQNPDNYCYLLKRDSVRGNWDKGVELDGNKIIVDKEFILTYIESHQFFQSDIATNIDLVIDATGSEVVLEKVIDKFSRDTKIIVTRNTCLAEQTVVLGVTKQVELDKRIFSANTCDGNAISHILQFIQDNYTLKGGSVTTVHPWLSYQNLTDNISVSQENPNVLWDDFALGRSSINNLIPKSTSAVSACEKVLPELQGLLTSFSYRVPTDIVASSDLTLLVEEGFDSVDLKHKLEEYFATSQYVDFNYESLVSSDFKDSKYSAVVDMRWTEARSGLLKFVLWYDNEWAYAARVVELAQKFEREL